MSILSDIGGFALIIQKTNRFRKKTKLNISDFPLVSIPKNCNAGLYISLTLLKANGKKPTWHW